jgi:hypothetical protein
LKNKLIIIYAVVIITMFGVVGAMNAQVSGALLDTEYSVDQFPTMWMIFTGNITLDSAASLQMLKAGKLPIGSTLTRSSGGDLEVGQVFTFSIGVEGRDLTTLSLDDINNVALDVQDDAYGEKINMGSTSFIGSRTELFENTTNINGVTEYFFYEHASYFDSDDYPYLLIEDASTPSDTSSKIVVGTGSGNVTVYDDIMLGSGGGDIWFRLDQHCSHLNVYNITITDMKLGEVSVFDLRSDNQWSDSRYNAVYVGEEEYTAVGVLAADNPYPSGTITEYQPSYNLGEGRERKPGVNGMSWLNSINASEVLACRSRVGEDNGIVRASGWSTYQALENDLLNAIASWEGIDVSGIRDYACEEGIALWKQSNSDVVENMHDEVKLVAERTNDIQTFVDLVSERTIPSSVFLVGTEPDVFGKSAAIKGIIDDGSIGINKFKDWLKQAANKVYDVTAGAIASVKNTVSGTIQWGQDLIGGTVSDVSGAVTGIVGTGGKIASNVVGAVTQKDGVLNPMNFMDKIRANLKLVLIIAAVIILIIAVVIIIIIVNARRAATNVANSQLARNVKVDANAKDFL